MPYDSLVVLVTASSSDEAETIAHAVVEERLAACAGIIPSVKSLFRWEGRVRRESEVMIVLKTRKASLERLIRRVEELHSYDVPEIIALSIVGGSKAYLDWLREQSEPSSRPDPSLRRGTFGPGF
jgi:periplasmic divalent cation tolerance protein